MAQHPLVGQGLLIIEPSRSHSDTPQSVGLLWTSDQPDAETSSLQHTTLTDRHAPGGIRTLNSRKWATTDPRLRPRGHRDGLKQQHNTEPCRNQETLHGAKCWEDGAVGKFWAGANWTQATARTWSVLKRWKLPSYSHFTEPGDSLLCSPQPAMFCFLEPD